MTRTGRLLRQAQRHAAAVCPQCHHSKWWHYERRRDDPRYQPALFVCEKCECEVQG